MPMLLLGNASLTKCSAECWPSYPGAEGEVNVCAEVQLRAPGKMANWPPKASQCAAPKPADAGDAAAISAAILGHQLEPMVF